MKIEDIPIGTRLELEIINREGIKIGLIHISQLLDMPNNENVIISCPIYESKYVFIALGTSVRLTFFNEKLNCLLFFTGILIHKENKENILRLHVSITSGLQKLQRRNYYRFDCNLAARYRIMNELDKAEANASESTLSEFKNALTKNISGSGACIVVDDELLTGTSLEVDIYLSQNLPVKAKCKIIRVKEIQASKGKKYEIGLFFMELTKKGQDDVVKFIFERQRELLKKNVNNK
jgi:c-di-GMP-binding flagellar brake protein YcgR